MHRRTTTALQRTDQSSTDSKRYLRLDEDVGLLACTKVAPDGAPVVPLWRRVYWGFLSREGEAIELRWGDVDLKHGGVTLDENKSDDLGPNRSHVQRDDQQVQARSAERRSLGSDDA